MTSINASYVSATHLSTLEILTLLILIAFYEEVTTAVILEKQKSRPKEIK